METGASRVVIALSEGIALAAEKGVTVTSGTNLKAIVRETAVRQAKAAL
jgi:hypothetical protein